MKCTFSNPPLMCELARAVAGPHAGKRNAAAIQDSMQRRWTWFIEGLPNAQDATLAEPVEEERGPDRNGWRVAVKQAETIPHAIEDVQFSRTSAMPYR